MENKEFKELSDSEYLAQFNFATQEDYRKAEDFLKRYRTLDPKDCPSIRISPIPKDEVINCWSIGLPRIKGDITPVKFVKCPDEYSIKDAKTLIYPLR